MNADAALRMLVSVQNADEAAAAAAAGADFIDLKDPAQGALGGLPPATIAQVVAQLRARHPAACISATIGDHAAQARAVIEKRVKDVAACGVNLVKVGITPDPQDRAAAPALVQALAALARERHSALHEAGLVLVFIADDGLPWPLVELAVRTGAFSGLMLDTQSKQGGSLLQRLPEAELATFVHSLRAAGVLCGLAGALRLQDVPALQRLRPGYAGFRSAVCAGERAGALDPARVRALRQALLAPQPAGQALAPA